MKPLNCKQTAFVAAFLKGESAASAARAAGYSGKNARKSASRLLHRVPAVRAAVDAGQRAVMEAAKVTATSLLQEAKEAAEFARTNKNSMALCKAIELQARLSGLWVERRDERTVGNLTIEIKRWSDD